jgi:hypothetical protein
MLQKILYGENERAMKINRRRSHFVYMTRVVLHFVVTAVLEKGTGNIYSLYLYMVLYPWLLKQVRREWRVV